MTSLLLPMMLIMIVVVQYDCELKIPIGPFKVGTKFDSIYLYYSESKIVLDKNEESYEFKLKLSFEYTKTFQKIINFFSNKLNKLIN
jgi:hypothetical protein